MAYCKDGGGECIQAGMAGRPIHELSICAHAFSDLRHTTPVTFLYLLKEYYECGTVKTSAKFKILQQQLKRDLHNSPSPGPFTFILQCLYAIPLFGQSYSEGFSHMLVSSLRHFRSLESVQTDYLDAKLLAARLALDILDSVVSHEERLMLKLIDLFEIDIDDFAQALYGPVLCDKDLDKAKEHLEHYIHDFAESESYTTAVNLIVRYSIQYSDEFLLAKLIESKQFEAAEKWASYMGKAMVCQIIQKYVDMKMLKNAYEMVKQNNLVEEFPDISDMYKESVIKKLAEKGLWELAERRAKKERRLLEFLVYLALDAGYTEMVDELCLRHSLDGYINSLVPKELSVADDYMAIDQLVLDDIVWVDDIEGLECATKYIENCKIVGVDCEWKPNYNRGSKPNKVSILQIASEKRAFIFDLIKLYKEESEILNSCLSRIMCSSDVLKLGYNLQGDLHHLSQSYGKLKCFDSYEMLLDIQQLFKEKAGGLSGLSKKILGVGLNKTRRNSNWEQRPLTQHQKEYAAMDAAVLVRIFHHVRDPHHLSISEGNKINWKSHIISRVGSTSNAMCLQKQLPC